MIYTQEFKTKCFNTLRFCNGINVTQLMQDLEQGNDNQVRFALEAAIDDEELYEYEVIDDEGERIVTNARIHAYNARLELYSEFMEQLVNSLDKKEVLV